VQEIHCKELTAFRNISILLGLKNRVLPHKLKAYVTVSCQILINDRSHNFYSNRCYRKTNYFPPRSSNLKKIQNMTLIY